jgi:hypothetical protein
LKRKGLDAMAVFAKLLVLIAIFLSASNANAFTSLSSVAGTQVWINHVIRLEEPMSKPTSEPTRKPTTDQMNDQTTKRLKLVVLLPVNQSSKRVMYCNASTQGPEGASNGTVQLWHNNQKKRVSFLDKPELVEIEINPPQATDTNSQNMWHMPQSVNLDTSRLRRSSKTEVLNRCGQVYSNMTTLSNAPLQLASKQCFKSALVIYTSVCTIGNELKSIAHSLQQKVTITSKSKSAFSNAMDSYHQVNTLYDGTINCFSTMAQSSIASNMTFTYKEAMCESDYCEVVKAMVKEVEDHESRNQWTIMQLCNMPNDTKTIMSIWSFKCKRYPDEKLSSIDNFDDMLVVEILPIQNSERAFASLSTSNKSTKLIVVLSYPKISIDFDKKDRKLFHEGERMSTTTNTRGGAIKWIVSISCFGLVGLVGLSGFGLNKPCWHHQLWPHQPCQTQWLWPCWPQWHQRHQPHWPQWA